MNSSLHGTGAKQWEAIISITKFIERIFKIILQNQLKLEFLMHSNFLNLISLKLEWSMNEKKKIRKNSNLKSKRQPNKKLSKINKINFMDMLLLMVLFCNI